MANYTMTVVSVCSGGILFKSSYRTKGDGGLNKE